MVALTQGACGRLVDRGGVGALGRQWPVVFHLQVLAARNTKAVTKAARAGAPQVPPDGGRDAEAADTVWKRMCEAA